MRRPHTGQAPKNERATFLREFLRRPGRVGAISPSSPQLAQSMVNGLDFSKIRSIVEYGPGSGVFTRAVLERLPKGWLVSEGGQGRFIAIEYSEQLAELVRDRFSGVSVVHDSAEHVEAICEQHGVRPGELDVVISGIAWVSVPPARATRMLEATSRVLRSGGEFRTFGYYLGLMMPGAWHLRAEVKRLFADVEMSRAVWANMPPAFVYRCRK